jgi:hypothetical protein
MALAANRQTALRRSWPNPRFAFVRLLNVEGTRDGPSFFVDRAASQPMGRDKFFLPRLPGTISDGVGS